MENSLCSSFLCKVTIIDNYVTQISYLKRKRVATYYLCHMLKL